MHQITLFHIIVICVAFIYVVHLGPEGPSLGPDIGAKDARNSGGAALWAGPSPSSQTVK